MSDDCQGQFFHKTVKPYSVFQAAEKSQIA